MFTKQKTHYIVNSELRLALQRYRKDRGFNAKQYSLAKASLLNEYFRKSGLTTAVLGISGGVDSAVTLALLRYASQIPNSPVRRIIGLLLPYELEQGTSNQNQATTLGRRVADQFDAETYEISLDQAQQAMVEIVDPAFKIASDAWSKGQLACVVRKTAVIYVSNLVAQQTGKPAIAIGTANRDEAGSIGYIGTHSDEMNMHLISDLHKSEVYSLAKYFKVIPEVLEAPPSGDVFSGENDFEMIGANYDAIELDIWFMNLSYQEQEDFLDGLDESSLDEWNLYADALDRRRDANWFKYASGPVAIHLDVMERGVKGGWAPDAPNLPAHRHPGKPFVGEFQMPDHVLSGLKKGEPSVTDATPAALQGTGFVLDNLLSPLECDMINEQLERLPKVRANRHGYPDKESLSTDGSDRAVCYSPEFGKIIWERVASQIPRLHIFAPDVPTNERGDRVWRLTDINPVARFITYKPGGKLVPHFDEAYHFPEPQGVYQTLFSLLIYLTNAEPGEGGNTRFILDPDRTVPPQERSFKDWDHDARSEDVLATINPEKGRALIFPHRTLHDGEEYRGSGKKTVIRLDIIARRCGILPQRSVYSGSKRRPKIKPLIPGVTLNAPRKVIDEEYERQIKKKTPGTSEHKRLTIAWKMHRDPYFRTLYQKYDWQVAHHAGFFVDSMTIEQAKKLAVNPEWVSTPLHKAQKQIEAEMRDRKNGLQARPLVALITTGAFCPVHRGQINMMHLAKEYYEKMGMRVVCLIISPDHDDYVLEKNGPDIPSAVERILMTEYAVRNYDDIIVDRWNGVYCPTTLNFTEVVERTNRYLNYHLHTVEPIRTVYVVGGDNARFAHAFAERGWFASVERPGAEQSFHQVIESPDILGNPRIAMISAGGRATDYSSTQARSGDMEHVPASVVREWNKAMQRRSITEVKPSGGILEVRVEGMFPVEDFLAKRKIEQMESAWLDFRLGVTAALQGAFKSADWDVSIRELSLDYQKIRASTNQLDGTTISLDACIKGDYQLGVSRCYPIAASSEVPIRMTRPGCLPLQKQFELIPAGEYILVDDDTVTGGTFEYVKAQLPEHIRIRHACSMATLLASEPDDFRDLCDMRDFLVGSKEGGLVVRLLNGRTGRAPYVYPYVQPASRISLPLISEKQFSREIWKLNLEFYRAVSPDILIGEGNVAFVELAQSVGFLPEQTIEEFCEWHIAKLA